jgi:WD40 repeat protein
MFLQGRTLQKENDLLQAENSRLAHFIELTQQRLHELSGSLQKRQVNVMPAISVGDDIVHQPPSNPTRIPLWFSKAGSIQLSTAPLTLADGQFLAAGESGGSISLISTGGSDSPVLYRFPSDASTNSLARVGSELGGHSAPVTSLHWHGKSELSSVSLDGSLRIWNVERLTGVSQFDLGIPSISHTIMDEAVVTANGTKRLVTVDLRDPKPTVLATDTPVTSVAYTRLGFLLGTTTGEVLLFDPRIARVYQSAQLCPTKLPISRISGFDTVTVTAFDGYVRTLGEELPLFVENEYRHAPINGSIIGSCALQMLARDDFIVSGSIGGHAIVWPALGDSVRLRHRGPLVSDCVALRNYIGAFASCDSAGFVTMWARCFDEGP